MKSFYSYVLNRVVDGLLFVAKRLAVGKPSFKRATDTAMQITLHRLAINKRKQQRKDELNQERDFYMRLEQAKLGAKYDSKT